MSIARTALLCAIVPAALACGASSSEPTDNGTTSVAGVVPTIVAVRNNTGGAVASIVTVNSDGSGYHVATTTTLSSGTAEATHSGKFVVFNDGPDAATQRLYVIDDSGNRRQLVGPTSQIASVAWPTFSPDLQWVYFRATSAAQPASTSIWRVKLDGSGLEQVGALRTTGVGAPTISPDAHTLMETTTDSVVFTVLATGATHGERVSCAGARYSPDGVHVACIAGGNLMVYDAQFLSAPRTLGDGDYIARAGTDWTPDGTKILATSSGKGPELANYTSGTVASANLGTTYLTAAFVK